MTERETVPRRPSPGWVPPMELDLDRAAPVPAEEETALLTGSGDPADLLPAPATPVRTTRRLGRWLFGALAALVLVALGFDTADLLARAFATSLALGVLVGLLAATAGIAALAMLVTELLSLRRLRRIEELRAEAGRMELDTPGGRADRFAGSLVALYADRRELAPALARVRDHVTDAHDEHEVVRLLDREVLSPLDRAAYQRVLRASRDTAVATALSPAALLDFAVVLWRNLKLVREIAALYGARPGYVGSLRLLRRMLANIAVAGVAESAHHVAVEALGGSLAAAISTRMGQGVINGLLTARVGLTAMHLCRPIAFGPDNRPSLNRIRKELLSLPKQVL
ncbi:TIGR01620 family protein [Azospirillum sp. A29]|uniref:TIGR01620 family protein n=1 Tax=Azospirillum sp. A29 TaxID=3160606 RepID=UPI00366D25DE